MASAIKCDRCGYTAVKVGDFMHIRAYSLVNPTRYNSYAINHCEVCQKCYDELFSFNKESEDK